MNAPEIVKAIDEAAAASPDYCRCGAPYREHVYWEDRIYDVNGRRCPGSLGGEWRFDQTITERRRAEAKIAALETALAALESSV